MHSHFMGAAVDNLFSEYVQVKPILAVATLILKATGTYKEGSLSWSSGYLYVSIVYNASICLRYAAEYITRPTLHD